MARCCFCNTYIYLDITGPWAGARRNLKPGPDGSHAGTGDGIVLGCGHTWGYTAYWDGGDQSGVSSPRHDAWDAWKGPSASVSGPAPKPRSRVCPSVSSRPPRVSAPVGAQLLGSNEAREIPRWQLSAARAEPIRRTTPRRRPCPGACPTFRPALRARSGPQVETVAALTGGFGTVYAIRLGIEPFAEGGANSESLRGSRVDSPYSCRAILKSAPVTLLQSGSGKT